MGQEDYLNNLLNSIADGIEQSDNTKNKEEDESLVDVFSSDEEEPLIDVFSNEEDEPLIDVFSNEEEEPLVDVFTNEEEEPLVDVFFNEEEEPLIDVFSNEEEPLIDVFSNEEEEPLIDVFSNEEEEPLIDIFSNEEDEVLEDVFANEEEEALEDIVVNEGEVPLEDAFVNAQEPLEDIDGNEDETLVSNFPEMENEDINNEIDETEKESDTLLNSIDDILGSLDKEIQEEGEDDRVEKEPDESNEEDIFAALEESQDKLNFENPSEESAEQSLFDDDLMKLLGEEDLSEEEVFLSGEETEAELAKGMDTKEANSKNVKNDKKPGLFAKLFKNTEEDETSKDQSLVNIDANEKKKKEKKVKPPKEKKAKKEKKPKKEKIKKPEIIEEPSVPLHKGQVVAIFILGISIAILIISGSNLIPYSISISTAKGYYEREEYTKAYYEVEGLEINKNDLAFYNKLQTIMLIKNQLDSFYTYERIGLNQEALSALLKGVSKYDKHYARAQQYGADSYYDRILGQIENELANRYSVTLEMARTINLAEDAKSYSVHINNITNEH